jgi:hypothetical protein
MYVDIESTLISGADYDEESRDLIIYFKKYFTDQLTYANVSPDFFEELYKANSAGKFYLRYIKPHFKLKKSQKMADKIIKCKIDVTKVNKDWLFQGKNGVYLNFTLLYNEEQDRFENNGMLVQDVPTEVYKADKSVKGNILGNAKEFNKQDKNEEMKPGVETGKPGVEGGVLDDLPF